MDAQEKLDRIAEGVARIDERTLNLEKHIISVSSKADKVREELNIHRESPDAHGLKSVDKAIHRFVAWAGLTIAGATMFFDHLRSGKH